MKRTKAELIKILDDVFTPDIVIKVKGAHSIITACNPVTPKGAEYLTHNAILEKSYDTIDTQDLCFEIQDEEQES